MMEENNSKKILLSVLGVAILVVAVVGISFAVFTATKTSSNANSIATGTITMSYTEPENGIKLDNAVPMSDDAGKALTGANEKFEFTVATNASGALKIPYEITLTPEDGNTLTNDQVKVYLTKACADAVAPTKISALTGTATFRTDGSILLYKTEDDHTTNHDTISTKYVLKMWVSNDVAFGDNTNQGKTYKLKVNVDSKVAPVAS